MKKYFAFFTVSILACLLLIVTAPAASAAVISVNFTNGTSGQVLAPTDVAGLEPAAHWNHSNGTGSGTLTGSTVVDDANHPVTAGFSVTYSAGGVWQGTQGAGPNGAMLAGFLEARGGSNNAVVTVTNIPYAAYDLIVYFSAQSPRTGRIVIPGQTTLYYDTYTGGYNAGLWSQAIDTANAAPSANHSANYARYNNLTASTITFTVEDVERTGIAGFQLVEVPEPATLALLGIGGLLIFRPRPRRSRA